MEDEEICSIDQRRALTSSPFAGQTAFCTAATSGIGLQSAILMAQGGAETVILNGRSAENGAKAADLVKSNAPQTDVHFIPGDLTERAVAAEVCARALKISGHVDVLVHAGGAQISPDLFVRLSPELYPKLIDGHFTALLHVVHPLLLSMIERGTGSIVVVASDAGKTATPGESLIGSMKAATIMFCRTLALEVARNGLRVNVVTPSLVTETKSFDRVMAGAFSQKIFEKATKRARLGLPNAAEVAEMVVFLASPLARKITGQAVSVNGGISAA